MVSKKISRVVACLVCVLSLLVGSMSAFASQNPQGYNGRPYSVQEWGGTVYERYNLSVSLSNGSGKYLSDYGYTNIITGLDGKQHAKQYYRRYEYLPQVSGLKASSSKTGVSISWNRLPNADGYYVYRRIGNTGSFSYLALTSSLSYVDSTASNSQYNYYKVFPYYKAIEILESGDMRSFKGVVTTTKAYNVATTDAVVPAGASYVYGKKVK